jgi:Ca2+-binding EF-hand superfamily protein
LINANGDSTIDHDEWLEYLLKMICGNFDRRLFIVFQMFDLNNDQVLKPENMKLLLKHVPIRRDHMHFGISHENENDSHRSRIEL